MLWFLLCFFGYIFDLESMNECMMGFVVTLGLGFKWNIYDFVFQVSPPSPPPIRIPPPPLPFYDIENLAKKKSKKLL